MALNRNHFNFLLFYFLLYLFIRILPEIENTHCPSNQKDNNTTDQDCRDHSQHGSDLFHAGTIIFFLFFLILRLIFVFILIFVLRILSLFLFFHHITFSGCVPLRIPLYVLFLAQVKSLIHGIPGLTLLFDPCHLTVTDHFGGAFLIRIDHFDKIFIRCHQRALQIRDQFIHRLITPIRTFLTAFEYDLLHAHRNLRYKFPG